MDDPYVQLMMKTMHKGHIAISSFIVNIPNTVIYRYESYELWKCPLKTCVSNAILSNKYFELHIYFCGSVDVDIIC